MLSLWTFGWVPLGSRSLHRLVSSFDLSAPPQSAKRHQRVAMFGRPQIIPNWFEEPIALFLLLTWFSDECQTSLQSIDWINSLLIKLYNFTLCFYSVINNIQINSHKHTGGRQNHYKDNRLKDHSCTTPWSSICMNRTFNRLAPTLKMTLKIETKGKMLLIDFVLKSLLHFSSPNYHAISSVGPQFFYLAPLRLYLQHSQSTHELSLRELTQESLPVLLLNCPH